jgi:Ca2+-dependent lipid-binding protein
MSRRLLLVDVMEAKNLIACVNNGTSNPYLSAKLLDLAQRDIKNEKFKSNVIEKSLKPNWNQRFTFGDFSFFDVNLLITIK